MHVAFDARELAQPPRGMGIYLLAVTQRLLTRGVKVSLLADRPLVATPDGPSRQLRVIVKAGHTTGGRRLDRLIWQETVLPKLLRRIRPDVYHAPANQGIPENCPTPTVLTVHDLIPIIMPQDPGHYQYYSLAIGLAVNRADRIVTISKTSRDDLYKFFPVARTKTRVIYNGVDRLSSDGVNPYAGRAPYFIYNGGFGYRKNVDVLLQAFAKVSRKREYRNHNLVLVGAKAEDYDRFRAVARRLGLTRRVLWPGYLGRQELGPVIRDAVCSVLPSRYEGFALPPLEAMTVGCPVIVARNSAMPETVGRAGLFVRTGDVDDLVRQLERMASSPRLRQRLVREGRRNLRRFSWDRTADSLLSDYRSVAG